ncbi:MAG: class I SAM-dependent methyltransferase [Candidatus Rokubacteria bacterium]|nr:class I SAM-dependent methyltransferase [Candidatus Rokubacteria bacterium]
MLSFWRARAFPGARFVVRDYDPTVVDIGARLLAEHGASNVEIGVGDWFRVPDTEAGRYHGVLSTHSLCCTKEPPPAIIALTRLRAAWVLIESLFYDGPFDVLIHTRDHTVGTEDEDPDGDFNIFSLPLVRSVFEADGYPRFSAVPFAIGVDLAKPADGRRKTYTVLLDGIPRAQFPGRCISHGTR